MKARNPIIKTLLFLAMIYALVACSDSNNNNFDNAGDDDTPLPSITQIVTDNPDDFSTLLVALRPAHTTT